MASLKPSSRYSSFDSRSSSASSRRSGSSSSAEQLKKPDKTNRSSFKRLIGASRPAAGRKSPDFEASPKVNFRQSSIVKVKNDQNLSSMVKKFVETRSRTKPKAGEAANRTGLVVAADFIAEDLKKTARRGTNFMALQRKLFSKGPGSRLGSGSSGKESREKKALAEVKPNTRTLAMVLRSERELLDQNKELEMEITELKSMLEHKNDEVEKLKDLCLKQRNEIKALKSAVLFPEDMNYELQDLLEKQGAELKQAKQIIPTLQKQVCSLTGQLQCLADDLAEVKADKSSSRGCFEGHANSPKTPSYDKEAANSSEYSSGDIATTLGSPDYSFIEDLNPCLTPYPSKTKSEEYEEMGRDSLYDGLFVSVPRIDSDNSVDLHVKVPKTSDFCHCNKETTARGPRRYIKNW